MLWLYASKPAFFSVKACSLVIEPRVTHASRSKDFTVFIILITSSRSFPLLSFFHAAPIQNLSAPFSFAFLAAFSTNSILINFSFFKSTL